MCSNVFSLDRHRLDLFGRKAWVKQMKIHQSLSVHSSMPLLPLFRSVQFSSVAQLVRLSATPWIAAHQASLSIFSLHCHKLIRMYLSPFCLWSWLTIHYQRQTRWLDSISDSMDMNLSQLWETVEDRGAWRAAVCKVTINSWTRLSNLTATVKDGVLSFSPWLKNTDYLLLPLSCA